ncbi:MAG: UDP-glucose/GDP-mannose dehydrogenase family protein [Bacteroidales bacterium]|nr:UDP-glucose/GDP-mannose dehydrogenase family protein [Bacteroidales bacterium]
MKICIVGTGYVGLVSGTCFAETGINVSCVDIDPNKIDKLNAGIIPIYEPGLEHLVKRNMEQNRLHFTTSLKEGMEDAQAVFIAVGTPPDEDGSADLQYVLDVAKEIGQHMTDYLVVVTKSTVPIGTSHKVKNAVQSSINKRGVSIEFDVASNPEFLKEGDALNDFFRPDRIVVGVDSERAKNIFDKIYKSFTLNRYRTIYMDIASAEMTKYAANAMLATKISFMNDIANFCEIVGADVEMVRKGIGSDSRIGTHFIYPGVGYGGSCFPKDVKALVKTAEENQYSLEVLKAVEDVNNRQKQRMYTKIDKYFNGNLAGKKIAIWGLSFKPNTDDMREAPSLVLINMLLEAGAKVSAYDPIAKEEASRILGDKIEYAKDQYEALLEADALLLVTEWREFRVPNFKVMEKLMSNKAIFDGRNIYEPEELTELGWYYKGIGR